MTGQEIIEDIKHVASNLNRLCISQDDYINFGKYPINTVSLRFRSFSRALEIAGLSEKKDSQKRRRLLLSELNRYYAEHNKIPTTDDIRAAKGYPSVDAYYYNFPKTLWVEILFRAGFKDGIKLLGLDGNFYDSIKEKECADVLFRNFIDYESHKKVVDCREWTCDFYIKSKNLWVEYDGLGSQRTQRFHQEKIAFYEANNYNFIILRNNDSIIEKCQLFINPTSTETRRISRCEAVSFLSRFSEKPNITNGSKYYGTFFNDIMISIVCIKIMKNRLRFSEIIWLDTVSKNKTIGPQIIKSIIEQSDGVDSACGWSDPKIHSGKVFSDNGFTPSKFRDGRIKWILVYSNIA